MGRIARNRLLYDGCYAHVFSRSISKQQIFRGSEDFEAFKKILLDAKEKGHFLIHHYCLMHTHFHLAVTINDVNTFSNSLKELKRNYTYRFNAKTGQRGPLWRERFKSLLIEDEAYLSACGTYIEQNPVKAGIAARIQDWPHSSGRYYEDGIQDPLIDHYEVSDLRDEIDLDDEDFFTKGSGIGTSLFRIHLRDEVGVG